MRRSSRSSRWNSASKPSTKSSKSASGAARTVRLWLEQGVGVELVTADDVPDRVLEHSRAFEAGDAQVER